jgi:tetratricopeptide (TPR) repeat protein
MHVLLGWTPTARLDFLTPRSNALYVENMLGLYLEKTKTTHAASAHYVGYRTDFLARLALCLLICLLCSRAAPAASSTQTSSSQAVPSARPRMHASPVTNVTVDGSEAMFTTMCALLAAGFESDVSAANWHPLRAQLRERMQHQQGAAVDAVREFYKKHQLADEGAMLSQYVWFGLVSGPAPKFELTLRRDELPPEVIALEGFSEILAAYYQEQKIGRLWRELQPLYNREIERLHDSVSQIVFVATNYLREMMNNANPRTFTVMLEPLVGRITNVRNFGDHYAIVLSGADDLPADTVRHAYLHFLLDPLPLQYPHVVAAKKPLFESAARAPRLVPDLRDDYPSYFAECMVRAVELKLRRMSPSERAAALDMDDAYGYVLARPLFGALGNFERSEPSMRLFFPEMVRSVDVNAEGKRVQAIKFAPASGARKADQTASEEVARRRKLAPSIIPNDPDAIAALTEGERRIAEKNPRAAESSFQKVLAKYPDQTRAWYGIGLVALMDHDGVRAKEVFGRLTSGEHTAADDPMVLAWSHIYLARIYDDEGQTEQARAQYQEALAVTGSPDQARQAAQKGLAAFSGGKPAERP